MKNIFNSLIGTLTARVMPIFTKIRIWLRPAFWQATVLANLRKFFTSVLNVKPRDKKDYYPFWRWLISKRLAFAIVIALSVVALWYVLTMSPLAPADGAAGSDIPTYRYSALPLKFYSGEVRIVAKDEHVAYIGNVSKGRAAGKGHLYGPNDELVYIGEFQNNMFEGEGQLFYGDETLCYAGTFSKNLFNGQGAYYRPSGTLEYVGSYAAGLRSGFGELYNQGGNKIFSGTFRLDNIVYSEFVGKTAAEVAAMYTGRAISRSSGDEYCVDMREIGAVYSVVNGSNTVDEEWRLGAIYVLSDSILLGGTWHSGFGTLSQSLGEPEYIGNTWVTLADAVALNCLDNDDIVPVDIRESETFTDVFEVSEYDANYEVYIFVYKSDGLIYTFFCEGSNSPEFLMYSIEQDNSN